MKMMIQQGILLRLFVVGFFCLLTPQQVSSFTSTSTSTRSTTSSTTTIFQQATTPNGEEIEGEILPTPTKDVVKKVAVAGATGKTGKLVVQELLDRDIQVVGFVRNLTKAEETFFDVVNQKKSSDELLEIKKVDLTNELDIASSLKECDAVIWCATGFSDSDDDNVPENTNNSVGGVINKVKKFFGIDNDDDDETPKEKKQPISIDAIGLPVIAKIMLNDGTNGGGARTSYPKVVMMSSAGVTRPSWSDEKKQKLRGCADIPIVRLNPFGILNIKAESEEKLRKSGVNYCVVRPSGLNDDWPAGARPIFSQGDVAVGRINRKDVATVLVDVLSTEEACDKTFEVIGLAGYPPSRNIAPALARLKSDNDDGGKLLTDVEVEASFHIMQQLIPGERQDPAALAMGQTYEELDKGKTGRLGVRGQENAEAAAPKPTAR